MADVIDFKRKKHDGAMPASDELLHLTMHIDSEGMYEVYMEVNDEYDDMEIFSAMMAAASKYAVDHELATMEIEPESIPANDS